MTPSLRRATTTGKNIAPRVAALLDVMQICDILSVGGPGHVHAAHLCRQRDRDRPDRRDKKLVITVRGTAFAKAAASGGSGAVEAVSGAGDAGIASFVVGRDRHVRAARADQRQGHRLGRSRRSAAARITTR